MRKFLVVAVLVASPAAAQVRGPSNEWGLNLHLISSERYTFEGGASARNDGGGGIAGTLGRNLNDYFALGAELTLGEFDHRSTVAPAAGNAGTSFETSGRGEIVTLRLVGTWYLLAREITPLVTAGAGVSFLQANFAREPPSNGCWVYPWYGQACGQNPPDTTLTRFSYGASVGARWDLPRDQGFLRALIGGEWIQLSEATSGRVGYVQVRADFGVRF